MINKSIIIALFFAIIVSGIGFASAATETIVSNYDSNTGNIETTVANLQDSKKYEIRYYPPGSLACNSGPTPSDCTSLLESNPGGYQSPNGQFVTPPLYHSETFTPNIQGWWVVALFHGGLPETSLTSFKVYVPVNVPIPEFATVAMPIATVLGLVFLFQHRKNKKE